jgi:hypothetical protein
MIGLALLERVSRDLVGRPGTLARSFTVWAMVLAAAAIAVVVWRWVARRVRGLEVEISGHPLRAAGHYEVAVSHRDASELPRMRVTLNRVEEAQAGDRRGGRNSAHYRSMSTQGTVTVQGRDESPADSVRRGHLVVPDRAIPTLALKYHWINWFLAVRLGGRIPWTVQFPVTVEPSGPMPLPGGALSARERQSHPVETDEPGALWLDDGALVLAGSTLSGGYSVNPVDGWTLVSVELSMLWETLGPGWKDLGVCHYEDRAAADGDDLSLFGTRSFQVKLPDGPPSYEGRNVKIHWLVRLRLRYADGGEVLRELPFLLGWTEV